jgi:hypothetical protein
MLEKVFEKLDLGTLVRVAEVEEECLEARKVVWTVSECFSKSRRQWQRPKIVPEKGRHTCKARWVTKSLMRLSGPPLPFFESRCSATQGMQGQTAPMAIGHAAHEPCTPSPISNPGSRSRDPRIRRAGNQTCDSPSSNMARWCATGAASQLIARHGPCSMQHAPPSMCLCSVTPNASGAKQEASHCKSGRLQSREQPTRAPLTIVICHRHCQERKPGSPRGWRAKGGCPLAQVDAPRRRRAALKAMGDRSWSQAESGRCVDGRKQGHREDRSGCSHSWRWCVCARCVLFPCRCLSPLLSFLRDRLLVAALPPSCNLVAFRRQIGSKMEFQQKIPW